jgi:hypothetical protein
MDGYLNVDIAPPADQIVDLAGPWPWPDSSVDEVIALDVCEHIIDNPWHGPGAILRSIPPWTDSTPFRNNGRIHFMNELHRVLKPGARATVETPNAARGSGYYQDPTHVSPWCLSTFKYFERGAFAHQRLSKSYGITAAFKVLALDEFETHGEQRLSKSYGITAAFKVLALDELETHGEDPREKAWKIRAVLEAVKLSTIFTRR